MYENDQRSTTHYTAGQAQLLQKGGYSNVSKQQQQQPVNYQYDQRYMNKSESNYVEMPRGGEPSYDMPVQQNGFYNARDQYNQSIAREL